MRRAFLFFFGAVRILEANLDHVLIDEHLALDAFVFVIHITNIVLLLHYRLITLFLLLLQYDAHRALATASAQYLLKCLFSLWIHLNRSKLAKCDSCRTCFFFCINRACLHLNLAADILCGKLIDIARDFWDLVQTDDYQTSRKLHITLRGKKWLKV